MTAIQKSLKDLGERVAKGETGEAPLWGGADVVIAETPLPTRESGFYPEPRVVVTTRARELSWLFEQLRDIFAPLLDGQTRIEFFGRLANAALRYQRKSGAVADAGHLLGAVLHEGFAIADEMEEGTFSSFGIAFGNEITDDYIDEAERRGFVGVEETRRFFAEQGIDLE